MAIRASDVNDAMIQHAAGELEVGVPIRSWRVEEGELVLVLAYGGEARWREKNFIAKGDQRLPGKVRRKEGEDKKGDRPWRFVEGLRGDDPPALPDGDLGKLKKRELELLLQAWGYQTETLNPLKREFVEALEWLRAGLESGGSDNG